MHSDGFAPRVVLLDMKHATRYAVYRIHSGYLTAQRPLLPLLRTCLSEVVTKSVLCNSEVVQQQHSHTEHDQNSTYLSLAIEEFRDIDFGDISKSESDRYRKDSRLCGRFWRTKPADGDAPPSSGLLPGLAPFSTSKLQQNQITLMQRNV